MPYHTEIMLFEIINLNYIITGEESIKLNRLEDAFYSLQDIINIKEKLTINNVFVEEIEKLLQNLPDYLEIDDDELIINIDPEIIYDELLRIYPTLTVVDYDIQEYVQNMAVYNSLNLPIPIKDTKEIFDLNKKIIQIYLKLAEQDFKGTLTPNLIEYLKSTINELKELMNDADNKLISQIKMACAYYNYELLEDSEKDFTNSNWRIILFSNNDKLLLSLCYDKVEYISEMIDYQMKNENEETLNNFLNSDDEFDDNTTYIDYETINIDEIPLFLTYYLIYLNQFIASNRHLLSKQVLENLLIKKYLLLCIPDLSNIEEYYLDHYTIDTLEPPQVSKEWFTNKSFQILLPQVMECALSLDYSDEDLKNKPYLQAKIIINSIFIKCFLELSVNENDKKNILDLIINNRYYKDQNYLITSNIIDEIIFNNNLSLSL